MKFNDEEKRMLEAASKIQNLVVENSKEQVKEALRNVLKEARRALSNEEFSAVRSWPVSAWADESKLREAATNSAIKDHLDNEDMALALLKLRKAQAELAHIKEFF